MSNLTDLLPAGAGGKQVDFVASGTVGNGVTVALNSDGTVEVVSGIVQVSGTQTSITTSYIPYFSPIIYDSGNQKVLYFYRPGVSSGPGYVQVGTVSGTSITFGTAVQFTVGSIYIGSNQLLCGAAYDANAGKILVSYCDAGNFYGNSRVGTVSGNSITFGTATVFSSQQTTPISSTYDSNAQKIVNMYHTTSYQGIVATISGTSVSFGSATQASPNYANSNRVTFDSSNNKVVASYADAGNSSYLTSVVGNVSGTSISFGSPVVANSSASNFVGTAYDVSSQKIIVASRQETGSLLRAAAGTVSGTSISFGAVATASQSNCRDVDCVYDATIGRVVVVSSQSPVNAFSVKVSGTSLVFSDPLRLSTSNTGYYSIITYDSSNGKTVALYTNDSGGGLNYNVFQIGVTNSADFVGISDAAISNAASGSVTIKGGISTNVTGLTANSTYYVQADGSLSTTASDVLAGKALSSTSINLDYTT